MAIAILIQVKEASFADRKNSIVQDGAVELWELVDSAAERTAIRVTAEETEGVRTVTDNIIVPPLIFGDH